jgi:hypothetical protein
MENSDIVVILASLPGAGKSTVIRCLSEMGFSVKSGSDDFLQPRFIELVNLHKSQGHGEYVDVPYYLSATDDPPFPHLEPHEWRKLDYALKAELRPHITKYAWKIREDDPEIVAKGTLEQVKAFPAAIDSARTRGDYTHFFDGPHGLHTYLLEIVASDAVRRQRLGEESFAKGIQPGSTEEEMVKMLNIYREKLAKDGRYIRLENNFNTVEELKQAIQEQVLPKLH